jgi:polyisoprenoid-binding protein YceI
VLIEAGRAGDDGTLAVTGDIPFRGVTLRYEQPMRARRLDDTTIELTGEATFDVRDFGMEPPRILMLRVEPEVTVRVEIVAERPVAAPAGEE